MRVCTVVARNYVAQARVLAESLRRWNPAVQLTVLLVDDVHRGFDPSAELFDVVHAGDLANVPFFEFLAFKYNVLELSTALKPFLMEHLLATDPGCTSVVYLDPDVLVCRPLDDLAQLLTHHAVLLTPHLLSPLPDEKMPNERDILLVGAYNLGFIGVARGEPGEQLLAWWRQRVYDHGASHVAAGLFTDQRWVDLVPSLYSGVHVLRDPAFNVAYWNLHERGASLRLADGTVCSGSVPISFFHYSGFSPQRPESISVYQRRYEFGDFPALAEVYRLISERLRANGHDAQRLTPYGFGSFHNGQVVPELARRYVREGGLAAAAAFGDPFETGPGTLWDHLRHAVDDEGADCGEGPPRAWWLAWASRPDLARVFPYPATADAANFRQWAQENGGLEFPDIAALCDPDMFRIPPRPAPSPPSPPPPSESTASDAAPAQASSGSPAAVLERVARSVAQRLPAPARRAVGRLWRAVRRPSAPASAVPATGAGDAVAPSVGLNVVGHFTGEFGIGEVSRGFLAAARLTGVPLSLIDVRGGAHRHDDRREQHFEREHDQPVNLFLVNTDGVAEHVRTSGRAIVEGRRTIGVWFWELPVVPARLLPSLGLLDEVWATSRFCADALVAAGHPCVVEVPFPFVTPTPTKGVGRAQFALPPDVPVFLTSFDVFSVIERKNPAGVVEAFRRAFGTSRDALLVVKSLNGESRPELVDGLRRQAAGMNVRFVDGHLDRGTMSALIAACDCYVSLHRSEGFGLGMAEAMALGKPVIATGYSGNLAFMDPSNSHLVPFDLVELERDHPPYEQGNVWADPHLDAAAAAMRVVVDDRDGATELGAAAARSISANLGPRHTARVMVERLRALGGPPAPATPSS